MSKSYYDSQLMSQKTKMAEYIESIEASLKSLGELDIASNWKCEGNNEVITKFEYLQGLIPSIKTSLNAYVNFLTPVNNSYTEISEDIKSAINKYNSNS